MTNPFLNKNIRSIHNPKTNTYYYCANDTCAALIGGTYEQGKNYWKSLKSRNNKFNINQGHKRTQMKLPAADGKMYVMDVINQKELIYLVRHICHKNALVFKKWLGLGTNIASHILAICKTFGEENRCKVLKRIQGYTAKVLIYVKGVDRVFNLQ